MESQWIGIAILVLLIGGLTFAFVRGGVKIRSDAEHKPPSDETG
jgi:hypothetical protein